MILGQYGDEELLYQEEELALFFEEDFASRFNNNYTIWTTKSGERINLCDMKTTHIYNCIRFCEQTSPSWTDAFKKELKRRRDSKSIYHQKYRIGDHLFVIHHSDIFSVKPSDIYEYIISELKENEDGIIYYCCRKLGYTGYNCNHVITRQDDVFGVTVFSNKAEAVRYHLNNTEENHD